MNKFFKEFIFRETILATAIALIGFLLLFSVWKEHYRHFIPILLIVFYLITALVHLVLLNVGAREPQKFVRKYMLASGVKMITYLFFILIFLLLNREDAIIFLISFLSFYLIFTVFEVFSILSVIKKNIRD